MIGCAPVIGSGMPRNVSPGCIISVPRTRWTPGAQQNTRSGPGLFTKDCTWGVESETGTTIPWLGQMVKPAAPSCTPPKTDSTPRTPATKSTRKRTPVQARHPAVSDRPFIITPGTHRRARDDHYPSDGGGSANAKGSSTAARATRCRLGSKAARCIHSSPSKFQRTNANCGSEGRMMSVIASSSADDIGRTRGEASQVPY